MFFFSFDSQEFLGRPDALTACGDLCRKQSAQALVLMSLAVTSGKPERQLGVYSQETSLLHQVILSCLLLTFARRWFALN